MNVSLFQVLARLGLVLARRGSWARVRALALTAGAMLLAVGLGALVLAHSYGEVRQQRADDIRPTLVSASGDAALLYSFDGFAEAADRPVTVISIWPLQETAPLPPGVTTWPDPGEAVLSPQLLHDLGSDADLYGTVVGTIESSGLEVPTERRVYLRPPESTFDASTMEPASGFGRNSTGGGYGVGFLYAEPAWLVNGLMVATLILPALVAIALGTSLDGEARDRRMKLLRALGAGRRHRAIVDAFEALPSIAVGSVIGGILLATACFVDLDLAWLDLRLETETAIRVWPLLALAGVASPVISVVAVVVLRLRTRIKRSRRAVAVESALPWRRAAACMLFAVATIWITSRSSSGPVRTLTYIGGASIVAVTLPALVSIILAVIGDALGDIGSKRGLPSVLIGGRRLQRYPRRTARLALGVCFGVLILGQIQLWASQMGQQYYDALQVRTETGSTIAFAENTTYGDQMAAFLDSLPDTVQPVWVSIDMRSKEPVSRVFAACPTLATLGLECTDDPALPAAPNVQLDQLLRFGAMGNPVEIAMMDPLDLSTLATQSATLVLVSPQIDALPVMDLQRAAYRQLPGGLQLSLPGQGWVTSGEVLQLRAAWTVTLGTVGLAIVAVAVACALAGDVINSGRPLVRLVALSGGRRWVYGTTLLRSAVPLILAAALGSLLYLTLPAGLSRGAVSMRPSGAFAFAAVVTGTVIALVVSIWAARRLIRAPSAVSDLSI